MAGDYICVSNVHTTVTAYEEEAYRKVQNGGIMAIPDGGPLSSVGQKRGFKNMKRTTGPSLMGEIFKISASKGYRHYFYGSTDETLEKLYSVLMETYPGIQIAGMYSPPFRSMTEEEDKAIVERKRLHTFRKVHFWIAWINPHFIHITARFPAANLMPSLLQLSRQLSCSPGRVIRV